MYMTSIQWAHDTENPMAGCDGCPLWPTDQELVTKLTRIVADRVPSASIAAIKARVAAALVETFGPNKRSRAIETISTVLALFAPGMPPLEVDEARQQVRELFRCYAGSQSQRFSGSNPGYPASFDIPQLFPGRMLLAAKRGLPTAKEIIDKPWLTNLRRLVFVSDMGDALSESVTFEYLEKEIVEVAGSEAGSRHYWLWLTKRAKRMAEFSDWLCQRGRRWPENLVPMASILNTGYAHMAESLLRIPAKVRGYSIEPLDAPLTLPRSLLGPNGWMILGGESGVGAKNHPFALEWARAIRDQCREAGSPFFFKQMGAFATQNGSRFVTANGHGGDWSEWPEDLRVRQFPEAFRLPA